MSGNDIFQNAANGDLEKLTELLSTGFNINQGDDGSYTVLHWAVKEGYLDAIHCCWLTELISKRKMTPEYLPSLSSCSSKEVQISRRKITMAKPLYFMRTNMGLMTSPVF